MIKAFGKNLGTAAVLLLVVAILASTVGGISALSEKLREMHNHGVLWHFMRAGLVSGIIIMVFAAIVLVGVAINEHDKQARANRVRGNRS